MQLSQTRHWRIRECRTNQTNQTNKPPSLLPFAGMDDVLAGIKNARLKSTVEKSPGGTPLRKNKPASDPTNPSDIIAQALRQKFQNSNIYDSPEGADSPGSSGFSPSPVKQQQPTTTPRPVPRPRPKPRPRMQQMK